ncbi:MAG: NADPH-dependent F420 reductase [Chloroflexi bacterium]|nr:NADPH-dependent F420 reductase [Chloroflexota bacterium]
MPTVAIIGGTGPEGRGLGLRLAIGGYPVIIGSREASRGADAAAALLETRSGLPITGATNAEAVREADWVLLALPFEALNDTVGPLASAVEGKLVVSVVAPLAMENGRFKPVALPQGSAAELVRALLPKSLVTSAFQNLSARDLLRPDQVLEGDVVVCGDDAEARKHTMELVRAIKDLRPVDAGPLANSHYVEDLTGLLLNLNRIHKGHATVRFLGI